MKRGGTALEVANAIVWLISDESPYTTGSLIEISGGNLWQPPKHGQPSGAAFICPALEAHAAAAALAGTSVREWS
jgi:hypothetical protein